MVVLRPTLPRPMGPFSTTATSRDAEVAFVGQVVRGGTVCPWPPPPTITTPVTAAFGADFTQAGCQLALAGAQALAQQSARRSSDRCGIAARRARAKAKGGRGRRIH